MGRLKLIRRLGTHQRRTAPLWTPSPSKNIMTSGKFLPVRIVDKSPILVNTALPLTQACETGLVSAAPKWSGGFKPEA